MFIYLVMAFWAGVGLVFNTRLSDMMASALAPTGALFTFIALWTGSLWGKPTWGTWWVWDARLTSELILLFLYFGFMALQAAIDDPRRADRAGAVLALVGVVNIPIIYFSVKWWNTLHQGASVSLTSAPTMAATMLAGMLLMALASWMYSIAAALHRVRSIILERERNADWVAQYAGTGSHELGELVRFLRDGRLRALRLGLVRGDRWSDRRGNRPAAQPQARRRRATRPPRRGRHGHETAHKRIAIVAGGSPRWRWPRRLVLQRLPAEPGVLLHALPGRRQRSAAGQDLPHRRHGGEGQRQAPARRRDGALRRDRHREEHPGGLPRRAAGPVPRGQGRGRAGPLGADGVFQASEVLAKHDENYMPPEAADAVKRAQETNRKAAQTVVGGGGQR